MDYFADGHSGNMVVPVWGWQSRTCGFGVIERLEPQTYVLFMAGMCEDTLLG